MKSLFLLIFTLILSDQVIASTDAELHDKYWSYRTRLLKKFLWVADAPGGSIPADHILNQKIYFGDATTTLGDYYGVLGTELKLLRSSGADTTGTLTEIYYALKTMDRLFRAGDLSSKKPSEFSGYYLRDDVDHSLASCRQDIVAVDSDWITRTEGTGEIDNRAAEESLDQSVGLLFGYRVLSEYLLETDEVQGTRLKEKVRIHVEKIIRHMNGRRNSWVIRIPGTKTKVYRGADAQGFSYAFMKIGREILGKKTLHNISAHFISWPATQLLSIRGIKMNWFVQSQILQLGATADLWGNRTQNILTAFHRKLDFPLFPLVNATLYNKEIQQKGKGLRHKDNHLTEEDYMNVLASAPLQGPNGADTNGWCSPNRSFQSKRLRTCPIAWESDDYVQDPATEFNGLDFMLLHNFTFEYFRNRKNPASVGFFNPSQEYLIELSRIPLVVFVPTHP